jgi:TetR/AcrR family transcriptional regulator, transcriptional repressor for nem operon
MTATADGLTAKGRATRARIVDAASELVFTHGVAHTTMEDVRRAAGVSGSQLSHYFADKAALVRAIVAAQADFTIAQHQAPELGELDTIERLELWARLNVERQRELGCVGGCRLGSLAGELLAESDDDDHRACLRDGFERWLELFRHGLTLMRERGDLRPDADPDDLALTLLTALQGGILLTQTLRDTRPLEVALAGALDRVRSSRTPQ